MLKLDRFSCCQNFWLKWDPPVEVRTEITTRGTIRTDTDQITGQVVVTDDSTDKTEVGLDRNKIIGEVILEEM